MTMCRFFIALALVGYASCAAAATVKTDDGWVEGTQQNGVTIYKGIPFAAPPVGALRWRDPRPVIPWSGVRIADKFSPICMQTKPYPPDAPPEPESENCLYLNIWAPAAAHGAKLPVMFWIYGGGLEGGSASTPLYAGGQLAQQGVIVVTANYRLGIFGFLADPQLTRESPHHSSGNYGLLDQIAALKWLHRNIVAFGGDPNRVTIFGQSSGSISVSVLVTSPLAKGLFQRAIGESGGLFEPLNLDASFTLQGAELEGQAFMARAGVTSIKVLRSMSASELMKVNFSPNPIIDGYVLTQSPYEAYCRGQQNDVPILIGSNLDEGQYFIQDRKITVQNFTQQLDQDFPSILVWLIGPKPGATDQVARAAAASFEGDMRFRWDMWTWARLAANHGQSKVYLYEFTRAPPFMPGSRYAGLGATHGMEMSYVFDHLDQQDVSWTPADRRLASAMSAYWTNFAKSGDPNGESLPSWPAFTSGAPITTALGETIGPKPVRDPEELRRISRLYNSASFIQRNIYLLLVAVVGAFIVLIVFLIAYIRRKRRSRSLTA